MHEDGTVTWAQLHTAIVRGAGGKGVATISMVEDITERQEAEEQVRQAQAERLRAEAAAEAAREADRLKSELVTTVSHELRTPMTSLQGFSELLVQRQYSPERQRELVGVMHLEARRLTALLDNVLDIQRLQAGRLTVTLEPVALGPVAEQIVAVYQGGTAAHTFVTEIPADLPAVYADREKLPRVLSNLVSNAVKYSPAGGQVCVAARQKGEHVHLTVSDDGLGIPADALERLYERFYRVPGPERMDIRGTGLGLTVVQELVTAQGGRVWAESEGADQGSTFHVTLPLTPADLPGTGRNNR